ncbi:hypothetical protein CYMTET_15440 [Cymbomonas tetramitiformis]|uniref:Uncharacterized protein n=1 Tax=Cymbomonas tetramitiformis TaxID=36881 RepID=A0AAE0GE76_9CHLO|nr:hypothetical protein CYMTET_15440 [Cymbomonas tetramitiformis]
MQLNKQLHNYYQGFKATDLPEYVEPTTPVSEAASLLCQSLWSLALLRPAAHGGGKPEQCCSHETQTLPPVPAVAQCLQPAEHLAIDASLSSWPSVHAMTCWSYSIVVRFSTCLELWMIYIHDSTLS